MRHLGSGGERQGLFGPQDIEMAQPRRQDQREQHQEEEPRAFHDFKLFTIQAMVP